MQPPDLSRRTIIAVVAIVAGVVVIAMTLLGGSGSSKETTTASSPGRAIEPVKPLDPDDKEAGKPKKDDVDDLTDPFARSFGASGRRQVTVSVSGNGYVYIGVHYRDRKKPRAVAAPAFTETRNVKGKFPLAAVSIQIPGNGQGVASRATCTIVIDGIEVSRESTSKPWAFKACIG